MNWKKSIFYLLILLIFYGLSVVVSLVSWGFTVPVAAGLGEFLIKKIFYATSSPSADKTDVTAGVITGTVGLGGFYLTANYTTIQAGIGLGFMIVLWQLIIGMRCIRMNSTII